MRTSPPLSGQVPQGGRTAFRDLRAGGTDDEGQPRRVEVAPKKGRALVFFPSFADGTPDERTLHAGEPTEHEKWIAQLWLHERPYAPHAPPGSRSAGAASDPPWDPTPPRPPDGTGRGHG